MTKNADCASLLIETERLILRPPIEGDFAGFCAFHGDTETTQYIGGVQTPPVVWRTMRAIAGGWALDGFYWFSVIEKTSGAWIGRVGPLNPLGWPGPEVGWGLLRSYWGRGYAREAATAAMNFAFDELGWDRVIHTIDPSNTKSASLAKALGSEMVGPGKLPDPFGHLPINIWAQSKEQWQRNSFRTSADIVRTALQ
jgi:RimJ/RimL family protein N-acetyltransferase